MITSENQIVCFPSFVLTVFWYSTSYTVIVVLWKMLMEPVNAPARWWPWVCLKCVSGLRRLEKFLNFLRCILVFDLVLKYGSDIIEGNWLQVQANLPAICRWIYQRCDGRLPAIAGNSAWNCRFFCLRLCGFFFLRLQLFLPAFGGYFYLRFQCLCL